MNSINKLIRTFFLTGLVLIFSTSCGEEETVAGADGDGTDTVIPEISLDDVTCATTVSSPTPVFGSENPYKPMNIYVYEAKVTVSDVSFDFPSGSVVAVYDGSTCVGTFTLTDEIGSAPISITAGADDGSSNGFTDGNDIAFKIWYNDCEFDATATFLDSESNATEAISFSQQGTAFVNLSITQ